ncbi:MULTISPECIES: integrase core domain-containing protein [Halomonas]|uniref:integrase core domain-containing protein n=1 Tax=Halomonas TaxID=2745 RepID=UPI000D38664E|nr:MULTISPECIES: integrase core domain-containing protein [Halomonas]
MTQEFTTPYTPEQNGLVERFFRSLKEECIWLHRFESLGQARAVISRWIRYYNEERSYRQIWWMAVRPHSCLIDRLPAPRPGT